MIGSVYFGGFRHLKFLSNFFFFKLAWKKPVGGKSVLNSENNNNSY